ncbi:hypothetical protein EAF00_010917 [Botryotinia globosa]|nr:hypothetical protein EAF00_010917 [Botryotinia globosa]
MATSNETPIHGTFQPRRPVRVANCSGYLCDPAYRMYEQISLGNVDFVTGDYLAEMNMAENAEAYRAGNHPGYISTSLEGLSQSLELLAEKKTKVVINGGALNPEGLARKVDELAKQRGIALKVGWVSGDDLISHTGPDMASLLGNLPKHFDSWNQDLQLPANTFSFLEGKSIPIVLSSAYLGAHAVVKGLREGADIIICGRVSDASPVIAAAWYWHSWSETDYDSLAGSLIAGHLIECSAYVTGANFSGFTEYNQDIFIDPGFPIAEIEADGSCTITKHEATGGMITSDTVVAQFLYEIQGNHYLNSDVTAVLDNISVSQLSENRVKVTGITGLPPPPTTKAAIFYHAGYQCQILVNATGYGTKEKWALFEKQMRRKLEIAGIDTFFELLEFQFIGVPETNPLTQLSSTTYCRVFAEAIEAATLQGLVKALTEISLQHFSGFHASLDMRTAIPKPFLGYYPALFPQDELDEQMHVILSDNEVKTFKCGHPPKYQPFTRRATYDTVSPRSLTTFGPTKSVRLGDIALARSGDKGANLNCGIFIPSSSNPKLYNWLQNYFSRSKMQELLGEEWKEGYVIERVEFPAIMAVHFVIYGYLGRGVSSSSRLDCLGKGFADYLRDKWVEVPVELLG